MMGTEIFNIDAIDASWAQKFTKTDSAILIRAKCIRMNSAKEAAKGEPIDAPSCPYKLQPDYQGNQITLGL